jgi:hypothetical protein
VKPSLELRNWLITLANATSPSANQVNIAVRPVILDSIKHLVKYYPRGAAARVV